jgi:hypothetical protein
MIESSLVPYELIDYIFKKFLNYNVYIFAINTKLLSIIFYKYKFCLLDF